MNLLYNEKLIEPGEAFPQSHAKFLRDGIFYYGNENVKVCDDGSSIQLLTNAYSVELVRREGLALLFWSY
jgi:hypothetical protein